MERVDNIKGQALVEFSLLLFIFMAIAVGMLFVIRLLTFQFWAQQEARYLAFEQTWVASASGDEPEALVEVRERFRRPQILDVLEDDRNVETGEALSDLLEFASLGSTPSSEKISQIQNQSPSNTREEFSFVDRAYAHEQGENNELSFSSSPRFDGERGGGLEAFERTEFNSLERAGVRIVTQLGLGERICEVYAAVLHRNAKHAAGELMEGEGCGQELNQKFGLHLAQSTDIRELYQSYEYLLEQDAKAPLGHVVTEAVRKEYYSFFDTTIRTSADVAPASLEMQRLGLLELDADPAIQKLLQELRYLGGQLAVETVLEGIEMYALRDSQSRDSESEKELARAVEELLHAEADEGVPGVTNQFSLPLSALPIPPDFGPLLAVLQSAIMRNVLNSESDLIDDLIDDSNKTVDVTYAAGRGIFPAADRRFDASGTRLTGRFFLVTQPWHIHRRTNNTGPYRDLGDQNSTRDDETEEAILRRRVHGLWLIPKRLETLFEPLTIIPGFEALEPVIDTLGVADSALNLVFDFIDNNPVQELGRELKRIPGLGALVPVLPEFPAVRPDAYPGTTEITDDKTATDAGEEGRNFQAFIDEQRTFSEREPNPDFN